MITQRSMDRAKLRAKRKLARIKRNTEYRFLGDRLEIVAAEMAQQQMAQLPRVPEAPDLVPQPEREDLEAGLARLPDAGLMIPEEF